MSCSYLARRARTWLFGAKCLGARFTSNKMGDAVAVAVPKVCDKSQNITENENESIKG